MDKRTFLTELQKLSRAPGARGNPGSYQTEGSDNCFGCMFSQRCRDCYRCNYAFDSTGCTQCTHIRACVGCHQGTHLVECERCVSSHFLVRCVDCAECTYCFGCVGLLRKEFHILNQPYDRKTYFRLVKALKAELGLPD